MDFESELWLEEDNKLAYEVNAKDNEEEKDVPFDELPPKICFVSCINEYNKFIRNNTKNYHSYYTVPLNDFIQENIHKEFIIKVVYKYGRTEDDEVYYHHKAKYLDKIQKPGNIGLSNIRFRSIGKIFDRKWSN